MPFIDRTTGLYTTQPGANTLAIENPEALAEFMVPESFTLPGAAEAMTGLRRLQGAGVSGLEGLLGTSMDERRKQVEDALFEGQAESINRQADIMRRGIREGNFGRGVGLSTITADDLDRLNRETLDAIGRARREAIVGAGAETRADQSARLAGLGQAFSQGTTGLQAEANVGMTNTGREQQGRTAAAQTAFSNLLNRLGRQQRGAEFGAELGSREALQERGFTAAENIASQNRLASGLGAGIGGLAALFAPALDRTLQGWGI